MRLFVALFAVLSLANATPVLAQCDVNVLSSCWSEYLSNYNLTIKPFPSFVTFVTERALYVDRNNLKGEEQVCKWLNTLNSCLGTNRGACMTTPVFEGAMGISMTEATEYNTDYHVASYQCGPGFQILRQNFYCLRSVEKDQHDKIRACEVQLNQSISQGFKCSEYNTYINCVRSVYTNVCGHGVSSYICNTKKTQIQANTHYCDSTLLKC
ncbi:hypothetical protein L596_021764 [Steinernema carpocapsae]|uniref:DUF19 domain-containing protein n=1 Tax=Steinernema carpocapsae TaxID=34508 RepID=A0A4V6A007_STECR|nr:hypothetical protein L596_021764 [Steinernema carpocapsae]